MTLLSKQMRKKMGLGRSSVTTSMPDKDQLIDWQKEYGQFDTVIVAGGVRLPCHRKVLMEHSSYFRSMFGGFREKSLSCIEIKDIRNSKIMTQIMKFMYCKDVSLNPRTVQDILCAATYLQIQSLSDNCVQYISNRMDKSTAVSIYLYTANLGPWDLHVAAQKFLLQHFDEICKTRQFMDLSKDQLLFLISNEKLLVSSEYSLFKAVISWISHSTTDRCQYIEPLLQYIYFHLMTLDEVEQTLNCPILKKNTNLVETVKEAASYLAKSKEEKLSHWATATRPPRWPKIFIVMRMYWKNLPMEYYDFRKKCWKQLGEVENWRSCISTVGYKSNIYLLGGEEVDTASPTGSRTVNRVTRYDCETGSWSAGASMLLARRWSASVALGDHIYCIGGIGGKGGTYEQRLASMESYNVSDTTNKRWTCLASMSTPRSSHTAEVMDGKIYVVGGGDGADWLSSAEVYDPEKNEWRDIANLLTKRWKCGLVHHSGYLYAVGGMDSPKAGIWGAPLSTVERYCPKKNEWKTVASMNEPRFGCAIVSYQGNIYVSGGFGVNKSILNTVEYYEPDTDQWIKMDSMKKMSGFVGGILIDRPVDFEQ